MTFQLIALTWPQFFLAVALVSVCFLMIVVILLQKGRGEGLAGTFGGSSGSAFGAKTGDVFTWITVGFAFTFLLLAVLGNYAFEERAVAAPVPGLAPAGDAGDDATPVGSTPVSTPAPATPLPVDVVPVTPPADAVPIDAVPVDAIPADADAPADEPAPGDIAPVEDEESVPDDEGTGEPEAAAGDDGGR